MTDDALAAIWDNPDSTPTLNGAKGRRCRRHEWDFDDFCRRCRKPKDFAVSRRSRNNGKRGRRAELTIAREIPGARKMGPLGLPWDVEVGEYARLQVKKLVSRPSANAIRKLIEAIPNTGDRLRGFVWVEAAGRGKRGRREVTFLGAEFVQWHGVKGGYAAPMPLLVTMPLDKWCAEFVTP